MTAHAYQVRHVGEARSVTHYRVSAGAKGGAEVTVRVGMHGVFACLTCLVTTCPHAIAARDYAAECAAPVSSASVEATA